MDEFAAGFFFGLIIMIFVLILALRWQNKQVANTEFEEELEKKRLAEKTLSEIKVEKPDGHKNHKIRTVASSLFGREKSKN